MADANLGTATVRTRLDIEGLRSGLNTAGQQIGQFADRSGARLEQLGARFTKLGGALTIGVTTPLVLLGRSFVNAASDAEETASKFETVFRSLGDGAERAADRFAESFGQSSTNARRLLGDTGDLLTGFGFTQAAALDLSVSVNELAVDLASFTNFSGGAEGASQALTKALLGETESLKSLGVAIRQTDVDAKVLELTQQGVTFETERQARAYATLQIAQDQSLNAIGDYARTSDSFANTQRRLANALNELSVTFGTVLLPVATRAAEGLTGVVSALADLPGPAQTAIVVLAGIAAAGGPVILFAGQLLTAIPKITTALAGLRTASLGFLGAGGILALLGVGVAVFTQRLIEANPALTAQKDAIEALKDEYAEYRGELVITSDAERAAAIDRLNTLRGEVQARIALLAELAAEEQRRAQALIDSPLLQFLLPGFIDVRGGARQDTLAEIQGLSETLNRLNLDQFVIQSGANTLVPPPAAPPPAVPGAPAGTTPPAGTPSEPARTVLTVFRDLESAGIEAERRAQALVAAGAGLEAVEGSISDRLRLVQSALDELLTDFLDDVGTDQIAYLLTRRDALQAELDRLTQGVSLAIEPAVTLRPVVTLPDAAQRGAAAAGVSDADRAAAARILADTRLAQAIANTTVPAAVTLGAALDRAALSTADLEAAASIRADTEAAVAAATAEAARANRQAIVDAFGGGGGTVISGVYREAGSNLDAVSTALANASARTAILTDTVQALVAAGAPAPQIKAAFDQLITVSGALPEPLVETYWALQGLLAVAAEGGGVIRRSSGRRLSGPRSPGETNPNAEPIPGVDEKGATIGAIPITFDPRVVEEATNEGIRDGLAEIEESGAQFRNDVINAGLQFGQNLAGAIKSGSPSGIFGALAGGVGGIIGAVNPLAGAIFSTVGSIVSGFLPGSQATRADAQRASGASTRGAPAVEINLVVNQSLNVQNLGSEARGQVDALLVQSVRRLESAVTALVPRITALETRTA